MYEVRGGRERATLVDPFHILPEIQNSDPGFSRIGFADFALQLFSSAQFLRHDRRALERVAPYVNLLARMALFTRAPSGAPVLRVLVGDQHIYRAELGRRLQIGVEYAASIATADHTFYSTEHWLFSRNADVISKPPSVACDLPCPRCSAPWRTDHTASQLCLSCHKIINTGRFDWEVEKINVLEISEQPPALITERSGLPVFPPLGDLREDRALGLGARLTEIYGKLNRAWSSRDLSPVRDLVSDGVAHYLRYWIEAYRQQGLHNELSETEITRTEIARTERDRHFEAITLRIFATGKSLTYFEHDGDSQIGSPYREQPFRQLAPEFEHRMRPYCEYWTLIRAIEPVGAHDWILAKIEQADTSAMV
jgi:hypothetical protein